MGPHQGSVEGEENLPQPAGHTPLNAPWETIGLLGNKKLIFFVALCTSLDVPLVGDGKKISQR